MLAVVVSTLFWMHSAPGVKCVRSLRPNSCAAPSRMPERACVALGFVPAEVLRELDAPIFRAGGMR